MPYTEGQRKHYEANRELYKARAKSSRKAKAERLSAIKAKTPCKDCGILFHPAVMDFHHRGDDPKKDSISRLMRGYGWDTVMAEVAKCDLLCANCHRLRHISDGSIGAQQGFIL